MTQTLLNLSALSAFCSTCPAHADVTAFLATQGFDLVCAIDQVVKPASRAAPGQYHYQDRDRTEVIYLAGKDTPEGSGGSFPSHRSRWWLYPGKSLLAYSRLAQTLSARWQLTWQPTQE